MSENVSFLYPITHVGSLYQLLCTTTHSAFPVVTPFTSQGRPLQNVTNKHVPALYSDDFSLTLKKAMSNGDDTVPVHNSLRAQSQRFIRRKRSTFYEANDTYKKRKVRNPPKRPTEVTSSQLFNADGSDHNIPNSEPVEDRSGGRENKQGCLILHGILLRSQLVQLLTKRSFFDSEKQVCLKHPTKINYFLRLRMS